MLFENTKDRRNVLSISVGPGDGGQDVGSIESINAGSFLA